MSSFENPNPRQRLMPWDTQILTGWGCKLLAGFSFYLQFTLCCSDLPTSCMNSISKSYKVLEDIWHSSWSAGNIDWKGALETALSFHRQCLLSPSIAECLRCLLRNLTLQRCLGKTQLGGELKQFSLNSSSFFWVNAFSLSISDPSPSLT